MGVQGLWQLLDSLGRPVTLESLENKVLAVDASLWIHQSVRGFRDRQSGAGGPVRNAHLLGAFHRLCKLLFYRIKPVFVFDGSVPLLKRETMAARRERRSDAAKEAENSRKEILARHLKLRAIQEVMSTQSDSTSKKPSQLSIAITTKQSDADLFDLPPMPSPSLNQSSQDDEAVATEHQEEGVDDPDEISFHVEEEQEEHFRSSYQNLEEIDVNSRQFEDLPLEIQREILVDLKETLKRKSWTRLSIMPDDPEEVGKHQIKQLLERRRVQQKLDKVCKEMSKSVWTAGDLLPDYAVANSSLLSQAEVRRIASEDSTHYILLKNNMKAGVELPKSKAKVVASTSSMVRERNYGAKIAQTPTACLQLNSASESDQFDDSDVEHIDTAVRSTSKDCGIVSTDGSQLELAAEDDYVDFDSSKRCAEEERFNESERKDASANFPAESGPKSVSSPTMASTVLSESQKKIVDDFVHLNSQQLEPKVTVDEDDDDDEDDDFVEVNSIPAGSPPSATDELFPLELFQSDDGCSAAVNFISGDDKVEKESDIASDECELASPRTIRPLNVDGEDLVVLRERLEDEMVDLAQAKDRQERVAASITDQMYAEIQELLGLFGVPYVVSPAEAEAQCAVLDALELTDGTITDDSDVWLFGATRVYKNFFNHDRDLLFFRDSDVQQRLGLNRRKLIAMALLTGSDYTDGIKGVGIVSALELLAEFGSARNGDDVDGIECLRKFRAWWEETGKEKDVSLAVNETKVKKSLRGLALHEGFPSPVVVNAYMEPNVDTSTVPFSWARPDLDELRHFACNKLGWSREKVDGFLLPVIKQLNTKEHQMHLEAYFEQIPSEGKNRRGGRQQSQRLRRAIKRVRSNIKECDDDNSGAQKDEPGCSQTVEEKKLRRRRGATKSSNSKH